MKSFKAYALNIANNGTENGQIRCAALLKQARASLDKAIF